MNIESFVARRQEQWALLERMLDEVDRSAERDLAIGRVQEIVRLYRQTCADLNQARSYTANPELLDRLNRVCGRGYRFIYRGGRVERFRVAVGRLFLAEIPATFRREQRFVLFALAAMVAGIVAGGLAVATNPSNGRRIIPPAFYSEDVRERVQKIESGEERVDTIGQAAAFGAFLYTHNIRVALLGFGLAAMTIAGAYWLLFYNGVILGAVAASYVTAGESGFFFAWVGPHGALEIPAIIFASAAGLKLGHAFWMPGRLTRGDSVRRAFPAIWRMLIATAVTLVCAGVVEGSFSQFSSKTFPTPLKIAVAVVLFSGLVGYLFIRSSSGEGEPA